MPRTLKDFCQRACSQKNPQGPPRKKYGPHKSAVSVPSVSFSRDSTVYVPSVKFVVGPVLRFLYRPYFLFFNPPLATKVLPPPLTTPACVQMGASVGLPAAIPLLIRFYVRKHTRGGEKQKIIVMDSGPVLNIVDLSCGHPKPLDCFHCWLGKILGIPEYFTSLGQKHELQIRDIQGQSRAETWGLGKTWLKTCPNIQGMHGSPSGTDDAGQKPRFLNTPQAPHTQATPDCPISPETVDLR